MLLEIIDIVMWQRQPSEEEAFCLMTRYTAQFISLSLWNVRTRGINIDILVGVGEELSLFKRAVK